MKKILVSSALFLTCAFTLGVFAQQRPAPAAHSSDLRVQIVVESPPGTYMPLAAPASTVISVNPATGLPVALIKCPTSPGVAVPATVDCSENNIPPSSSIKLTAVPATVIPNATFYQWKDIQPFYSPNALAISNACIYSSFMPNITCAMSVGGAGESREIQAVYKCNDTFTYNPSSMKCEKPAAASPCDLYNPPTPARSDCGLELHVVRLVAGINNYKVALSLQSALASPPAAVNAPPSSSSSCVNVHGGPLITGCDYFWTTYPTPLTLTATAINSTTNQAVALPSTFKWITWAGGPCNGSTAPTCTIILVRDPTHPLFGLSNGVTASF